MHMSKMIQVRNVPDDVHRTLKVRAAQSGMTLSDYIKRDLERQAKRPTPQELAARIAARGRSNVPADFIVDSIRELRGD